MPNLQSLFFCALYLAGCTTASFLVNIPGITGGLTNGSSKGLLSGTGTQSGPSSCDTQPQDEYATTVPSAVGIDADKLQTALQYASLDGSTSIMIFRNGCLIGQGYEDELTNRVPELNAGQTKAVVALVAGIVADKGWIDINAPIADYIPANLGDAAHRSRTLWDFMTETSGVQVNAISGLNFFLDISRTNEYFSTPLLHPAGKYYEFDEVTPSVVVYVLQQVIGKHMPGVSFQNFAQCELFDALGIPESAYFWQEDRSGVTTGYSGLWLRPLEYGRLGLLMINEGKFGGKQIISSSYIQKMREGTSANCGFGLYVWLNSCKPGQMQVNTDYPSRQILPGEAWVESAPSDMWYSLGLGTNTYAIPSLDIVVTRAGYQELDTLPGATNGDVHGAFPGNAGGAGEHEFFRLLMDAVIDMPESVNATIENSGPYNRPADEQVDLAPFLLPLSAPLGSYTAIGPSGPVKCNAISCKENENNGDLWIGEIPRTLPGLIGLEQRPSGADLQQCNSNVTIFPVAVQQAASNFSSSVGGLIGPTGGK